MGYTMLYPKIAVFFNGNMMVNQWLLRLCRFSDTRWHTQISWKFRGWPIPILAIVSSIISSPRCLWRAFRHWLWLTPKSDPRIFVDSTTSSWDPASLGIDSVTGCAARGSRQQLCHWQRQDDCMGCLRISGTLGEGYPICWVYRYTYCLMWTHTQKRSELKMGQSGL